MMNTRRKITKSAALAAAAVAAAVTMAVAGCGSSSPELHGSYTIPPSGLVALFEFGYPVPCNHKHPAPKWRVAVSVDDIYVGSVPLSWKWQRPAVCTGTWSMAVSSAQHAYEVRGAVEPAGCMGDAGERRGAAFPCWRSGQDAVMRAALAALAAAAALLPDSLRQQRPG
jgi:hypothetical protein